MVLIEMGDEDPRWVVPQVDISWGEWEDHVHDHFSWATILTQEIAALQGALASKRHDLEVFNTLEADVTAPDGDGC